MTQTPKRALIVVDVQNDYDAGGALAIQHPPFNETLPNVAAAMDAAHGAGLPVIVIRMDLPEAAPVFAKGTQGADLHPEIARRHADVVMDKRLPSAFTGTGLEEWLRERSIDTVSIVGYMTQNCDFSTAVHALHMGFTVEVLSDATGTVPYANSAGFATAEEIHRVVLVVMQARFAAVCTTAEWIGHLAGGTRPEAGDIIASFNAARAGDMAASRASA
ncbi:cysteine hydrolase family protein [Pelagibacterium limicola]|uniref:cysteine hydrolase family protein n=1 Tax=Pelagibacterium limicola TaxID=2791022 RepID=UPI0018B0155D|nr:cysteine hydrolase family protein [Pelagibacterium limicola]